MSIWLGASIHSGVCSPFWSLLEPHLWYMHCLTFFNPVAHSPFLPFFIPSLILFPDVHKNSSSSNKQDNGHPDRRRDPPPHLSKWALWGQRGECNAFTLSSQRAYNQKTLISENLPLSFLRTMQNHAPSSACQENTNCRANKPVLRGDKDSGWTKTHATCFVQHGSCPHRPVTSSTLSATTAVSWPPQPSWPANPCVLQLEYSAGVGRHQ